MAGNKPESTPQQTDGERAGPESEATVNLPALISDNFGTPTGEVRKHIAMGTVEIDGEEYTGKNKFDLPVSLIVGKQILVTGELRSYSFRYDAP